MNRLLAVLFLAGSLAAQSNTQPTSLLVSTQYGITAATQVFDNRSNQRQCDVFGFMVTANGGGAWSVQMEYADTANTGPWTPFTAGIVTNTSAQPIGGGYGFHKWVRLNTTAGSTTSTLSCAQDFFQIGTGGSGGGGGSGCGVSGPCTIPEGGTGQVTAAAALAALQYQPYLGPLTVTPIGETTYQSVFTLDIRSLGAIPNAPLIDNHTIIQNAMNEAAILQVCDVFIPGDIWYVNYNLNVPTCVKLHGTASFGQPSEYGGPQYGSVIEAMPGFSGPTYGPNGVSPYPGHFMISIDGSDSLIGYPGSTVTEESDTYGAEVYNLTFDCNGVSGCNGIFVGHRNENSKFHDMIAENWTTYGYFDCGAGTGGAGPGGNTPCGPASGDNGGGPDDRIQITSYGSWVTSATIPAVFLQSFNRGIRDWTINNTPGPIYGMYLEAGPGFYLKGVHMESEVNGIWNGPTSGLCATISVTPHCNGSSSILIEDVSMNGRADGGSSAGAVLINDNVAAGVYNVITYDGGGPVADVLYDAHNGIHAPVSTSAYLGNYNIDYLGHPQNPNSLTFLTGELYSTANIVLQSIINPQLVIQDFTSPTFYAHQFYADPAGNMNIGSPGTSPGNWLWNKGFATLSGIGNTTQHNGWNIQGLASAPIQGGDTAMTVNAYFGSNVYWQQGAFPVWRWGNIGGTGFSGFLGMQNGRGCILTSNVTGAGGSELNSTLLAGVGYCVSAAGNGIFGSGATTQGDSGDRMQVVGSEKLTGALKTGTASNTDLVANITLAGGTGTYTLAGTYTTAPECFSRDKTTAANANSCACSTTICTATGTGTDVITCLIVGHN